MWRAYLFLLYRTSTSSFSFIDKYIRTSTTNFSYIDEALNEDTAVVCPNSSAGQLLSRADTYQLDWTSRARPILLGEVQVNRNMIE